LLGILTARTSISAWSDEYEIRERHSALERKLELISQTAQTVLEFMQHSSSLRVEWYVVILIVVETAVRHLFKG